MHAAVGIALFRPQIGEPAGESFIGGRRIERGCRRVPQGAPRLIELGEQFGDHALQRARLGGGALVDLVMKRADRLLDRAHIDDGLGLPIEARAEITDHALEGAHFDDRRRRPIKLGADLAHQPFQRSCVERRGVDSDALIDLVVQRTQRLFDGARVDDRLGPAVDARAELVNHILEGAGVDRG